MNSYPIDIFGGTFDPVTEGHVSIVSRRLGVGAFHVIAPTSQNPYKERKPSTLEERLDMWRKVLEYEGIQISKNLELGKVYLSEFPYIRAFELVEDFRARYPNPIRWIVGEDIKDEVKSWARWDTLGVELIVEKITIDVHSTDVRENRALPHPALI